MNVDNRYKIFKIKRKISLQATNRNDFYNRLFINYCHGNEGDH